MYVAFINVEINKKINFEIRTGLPTHDCLAELTFKGTSPSTISCFGQKEGNFEMLFLEILKTLIFSSVLILTALAYIVYATELYRILP